MDIDKEMRPKIALSLGAVALLVVVFVGIGLTFGANGLTATGGYALIGALIGFVLLMGVVGAYLSSRE
jgi:uncharacterized membrane protein